MSAIDLLFQRLRSENRRAFVPFLTAGDPDLAFTQQALLRVAKHGASLIEVGIPYSDPIADGPVIQSSYTRALAAKIKLADIFQAVGEVAPQISCPLAVMTSYAIIFRKGPAEFIANAKQAGFAGAIVPDLPLDEADAFSTLCKSEDFNLIQLVTPTTPRERALRIAEASSGFIYFVSVAGITGERRDLPQDLVENVRWLREQTSLPVCVGFGISRPEHVRLLRDVADGVIVGSAFVRKLEPSNDQAPEHILQEIAQLTEQLMSEL